MGHFNPYNVDKSASPGVATGSVDQYEVGDLSGKFGDLKGRERVQGTFVDPSLCLWGPNSVLGRSVVIHHSPKPSRWVCTNIELASADMMTAVATPGLADLSTLYGLKCPPVSEQVTSDSSWRVGT